MAFADVVSNPKKIRVLCVDDSPTSRAAVIVSLGTRREFSVRVEADPMMALEEARRTAASGETFDLLLLDIEMGPLDGFELFEKLRGIASCANAPVVFLSGTKDPDNRERAASVGAALVVKSKVRELRVVLEDVLREYGLWGGGADA